MDQKTEACSRDGDRQSTRLCARCPASQAWALRQGILEATHSTVLLMTSCAQ